MKRILIIALAGIIISSCKDAGKNSFTISGKIINAGANKVYLEQLPIGTMNSTIVDSTELAKDGTFNITTEASEDAVYDIRLEHGVYPVASVINDQPAVEISVVMSKENNQFSENYDVKGSPASLSMKNYMTNLNQKLQDIFVRNAKIDSLQKNNVADSTIATLVQSNTTEAAALKEYVLSEMKKSDNAALTIFELGYYQSTANNPGFKIEPLSNDQVNATIADAIKKNPNHKALVALQKDLQAQMDNVGNGALVGKQAPDFTLPGVDGNPVALNSFKGKYVLVDFWASWCKPCRMENPNVVAAYNKFKDKNFTVLGVSLDQTKDAWEKAIKMDKLTWTHVSDLKYWDSQVVSLYGFDGIPFNVLLDPQGKVIAQGLHGSQLEAKLSEVLK